MSTHGSLSKTSRAFANASLKLKSSFPKLSSTDSRADPSHLTLLENCSSMKELKEVHAQFIIAGLTRFAYVSSRFLAFCSISEFGDMKYAQCIFDKIEVPTMFNWNNMIKGYSQSLKPELGILIYVNMRRNSVDPNMHTFPVLLKACDGLCSLSQVHSQIVNFGLSFDVYVVSSLIKMYSKYGAIKLAHQVFEETPNNNVVCWGSLISGHCCNGLVKEARQLFDRMPTRNDVSWSAMVSGYVQNGCFSDALELFRELKGNSGLKPNPSLLVSAINACGALGATEEGRWIHSYIDANGYGYSLELGTALVDFYSKCGFVQNALRVFNKIPRKDVTAWSAMIMGLAINGCTDAAVKLFTRMKKCMTKPNSVTFIGVLSACNHGGLVHEGQMLFESMSKDYGISPAIEHYGCMVDLLSRAGRIKEAEHLIRSMPMEPDGIIWGALLKGCMVHGHFDLGEVVGKHLIELEPQQSGRYVLLANMYATMGRWEGVFELRRIMKERGVTPVLGWSCIEINGDVYRFVADDKSYHQLNELYNVLNLLNKELTP